jgi:hypothetical protein
MGAKRRTASRGQCLRRRLVVLGGQARRDVALGVVGQEHNDQSSNSVVPGGDGESGVQRRTRRDAGKNPFLTREPPRAGERVLIRNREYFVEDRAVQDGGDEADPDSRDQMVPRNAADKRQRRNPGVTEIVKIPNRGHSLTIDHGWRVATGGNPSQVRPPRNPQTYAKTVAGGCDLLPQSFHGKEGVDGSSPSSTPT